MLARYPLISQRKVVIHSALEAVTTQDLAISAIDAKTQEGISLKWIKAQLIDVFNFCGAFGVVNDTHDKKEGMGAFLEKRAATLTDF